jgi:membrane-associated protease RseP (regulator of RpoE activity)
MEDTRKLYTITILIALAGVLMSLIVGCFAGGMAGYWIASRQTQKAPRDLFQEFEELERFERPELLPHEPFGEEFEFFRGGFPGAVLTYVEPGGPADEAGLEEGDVISAVDGREVDENHPLDQLIRRYKPGDIVEITYWRGEQQREASVRLGQHPDQKNRAYLGIRFMFIHMPHFERPED